MPKNFLPLITDSAECKNHWTETDNANFSYSEDAFLAIIDQFFPAQNQVCPKGRGDDCAELENLPHSLALSTDLFVENIHFRRDYFLPQEVGAKALISAVSDLASSGAVPSGFSLSLILPPSIGCRSFTGIISGMSMQAQEYGIFLTGGDLSRGGELAFSLTVWGSPQDKGTDFLRRGAALPGDIIFLIGKAGLAASGLWALQKWGRQAITDWPESCQAHLCPTALLQEGRLIADLAKDSHSLNPRFSLMDLSDGLARDIPRLVSGYGADLDLSDAVPLECTRSAKQQGIRSDELVLLGGEDYALIGTCAEHIRPLLLKILPGTRIIGQVSSQQGIKLNGTKVSLYGFDHFKKTTQPERPSPLLPPTAVYPDIARAGGKLADTGREAWQAGLMAGFNGNISFRLSEGAGCSRLLPDYVETPGDYVLITRSGAAKSKLLPSDFCLLSLSDPHYHSGAVPSTESQMHLAVYRSCPDSRAILHTHPPHLLALCLALPLEGRLTLPLPEAKAYLRRLAFIPFYPPGSAELAEAVSIAAAKNEAVWMEAHGLVTHGKCLTQALSLTEELEHLAKTQLALLAVKRG